MTRKQFFSAMFGMVGAAFVVPVVVKAASESAPEVLVSNHQMPFRFNVQPVKVAEGWTQTFRQGDVVQLNSGGRFRPDYFIADDLDSGDDNPGSLARKVSDLTRPRPTLGGRA